MEQKSGGNPERDLQKSIEESIEEIDFPVIELTDVVEKGPATEIRDRGTPEVHYGQGGAAGGASAVEASGERGGQSSPADSFTLPREDFSGLMDETDDEFTFTDDLEEESPAVPQGAFQLDEKRLEEIVARVVEDVVERVTRETVARVTEKVLTAAIEAIRENFENSSK